MRLADGSTEQDVLEVLQEDAYLVHGLWVPKSKIRYQGIFAPLRDYVLYLLHKKGAVELQDEVLRNILKNVKDSQAKLKVIFAPLALQRPRSDTWLLNKPTDRSFIENYPEVVKKQDQVWSASEKDIMACLSRFMRSNPINPILNSKKSVARQADKQLPSMKLDHDERRALGSKPSSQRSTMSPEVQDALLKVLQDVFRKYNVCSLQLVRQGLREMASSRVTHPKHKSSLVVAAAHSASSAPDCELQSILSEIALEIHGVYVLKSLNDTCDEFRNFVISLLRARGPKAKIKRTETSTAFKMHRNIDVPKHICNKVLNELCYSEGNGWVLKSGDGKPP